MLSWHSLGERSRPDAVDWLTAGEAERAAAMRFTKRRDEWLLARWTAKQALAGELDLADDSASLARIEIRTIIGGAAQGAPEVFVDGVRYDIGISLTDRAGWAVCAVGAVDELGCDLELVEPRSEGFVRDFLTPCEQAAVADPPVDASADAVANLVWSAKESALKVLRTGLRRATRSVEVGFPREPAVDGWQPLIVRTEEGRDLPGWWRQYGEFVLTVVTGRPVAPPQPLIDPPGLATARPSHSWLASPLADPDRAPRPG
jgi:4'-phosphopantetheinyl transferase